MPSGDNLWNHTLVGKRRRPRGTLRGLLGTLWYAIQSAHIGLEMAMRDGDDQLVLRYQHSLAQLSAAYQKVATEGDLEQRIVALEANLQGERNGQ